MTGTPQDCFGVFNNNGLIISGIFEECKKNCRKEGLMFGSLVSVLMPQYFHAVSTCYFAAMFTLDSPSESFRRH